MQINKELSHLKAHFLEGKSPEKSSLLKGSSVRRNGFLPFTLGVNVGWIVSLFLWKLCVKQAEKSGLSVSEWIGQKIFAPLCSEESTPSQSPSQASSVSTVKASTASSASVKAPAKSTKTVAKAKKAPVKKTSVKKTKSSSKRATISKATKAEEKKTAKKPEKTAKKTTTASKAKKKVKKSEDKT